MNWLSWAGRTVTGRRAERQTITFTEPVRRAEVKLPAGAVSFAPADGPARVHRTIRWAPADRAFRRRPGVDQPALTRPATRWPLHPRQPHPNPTI